MRYHIDRQNLSGGVIARLLKTLSSTRVALNVLKQQDPSGANCCRGWYLCASFEEISNVSIAGFERSSSRQKARMIQFHIT